MFDGTTAINRTCNGIASGSGSTHPQFLGEVAAPAPPPSSVPS
jgi:hypothetical protein